MPRSRSKTRNLEPREKLVAQVGLEVRRMGAQSVLMSKAVAAHFDLNTSDLECLDLIFMRGGVSAGDLARATGLTSGAITALIDRMEHAGYVERVADPGDRRRRVVRVRPEAVKPIEALYEPIQQRMTEFWSTYNERDLTVIIDFLSNSTRLGVECTKALLDRDRSKDKS